jgi:hypothetical protein
MTSSPRSSHSILPAACGLDRQESHIPIIWLAGFCIPTPSGKQKLYSSSLQQREIPLIPWYHKGSLSFILTLAGLDIPLKGASLPTGKMCALRATLFLEICAELEFHKLDLIILE